MSNELRSVHEIPPDGGMVDMGPCVDCKEPWFMTAREWADWQMLIKKKDLHWPKRCRNCRAAKRGQPKSITLTDICTRLMEMADKAVNEEYSEDPDTLAQDLTDVSTHLRAFMSQPRRQ